jgi:hypothetical protein
MMQTNEDSAKEILMLLEDAHQQLLDTHNYGIDLLIYRAIQLLKELPHTSYPNRSTSESLDGMDLLPVPSLLLQNDTHP